MDYFLEDILQIGIMKFIQNLKKLLPNFHGKIHKKFPKEVMKCKIDNV